MSEQRIPSAEEHLTNVGKLAAADAWDDAVALVRARDKAIVEIAFRAGCNRCTNEPDNAPRRGDDSKTVLWYHATTQNAGATPCYAGPIREALRPLLEEKC